MIHFFFISLLTYQNDSEPANSTNAPEIVNINKIKMMWHSFKSIMLNPVLFMTFLGVIGGFVLTDGLPKSMAAILKVCKHDFFI